MKKLNPLQSTVGYIATLLLLFSSIIANAQIENRQPFPFEIKNHTNYPDNEVYVAVLGEDLTSTPGNHIWLDIKSGTFKMMNRSYNTKKGPVYFYYGPNGTGEGYEWGILSPEGIGNKGPFNDAMYADCFTKLSEIPNKTIMLPMLQGCRVLFSYKSQLWICFQGSDPKTGGYTAPAVTDPTDPNQEITWDMIELTYDKWGYFANTSRVDSYNIPMGMETIGQDRQWDSTGKLIVDAQGNPILFDSHKKVGEKKKHSDIVALWKEYTKSGTGREEFANCFKPRDSSIIAPGKIRDFADGSVGTMPKGPYVDYFKSYVDKVWQTYSSKDLVFDSGDAGVWTGRVTGETFTFTCDKPFGSAKGIITRKPTTQEVFEGKGCLDEDVQKLPGQQLDRVIQAQICAALNRHVIPVDGEVLAKPIPTITKNGKSNVLDFSKSEYFYQAKPSNYYAAFWHQFGINMDDKAYGFCYDDVWNYASAGPSYLPSKVIVHLDGYATVIPDDPCLVFPTINAGSDIKVSLPSTTATLAGSVRDELSRGGLTYSWTKISGPAGGTLSSASLLNPSLSGLIEGTYTYELTATISGTCAQPLTKKDQVTVTVSKEPIVVPVKCGGEASGTSGSVFQWEVDDSATPTVTFIPVTGKSTKPVVFLYSVNGVDKGGWNNFNGMNITLSGTKIGDKVKFYYVYTIPQGGEANNQTNLVEFEVGKKCTITAIKSVKELENEVTLYPNPASRQINIKVPEETFSQIQIVNTTGSIVYMGSIESEEATFDIEELPRGIYFVKLIGETTVTKKFIKK